jgi:tetratricopeptide (TPR) repeat protein
MHDQFTDTTKPPMSFPIMRTWLTTTAVAIVLWPVMAFSIDTVTRRGAERPVGGAVKSMSKTEIVVFQKVGNKEEKIPANEILLVDWDGEPPEFGLGRGHVDAANYTQAMEQLTLASKSVKGNQENIKADIEFFIAKATAKMALADPALVADAVAKLKGFLTAHRENFRFYEAQGLLAEVALLAKDTPTADAAFNSMTQCPWLDTQLAGKNGLARVLLASNNVAGAKTMFDDVVATEVKTPAETASRLQAMLGQARCLQLDGKLPEAISTLDQVIEQASTDQTRILAEAYVRQGDCLAATGKNLQDAILAYLHVDVIPVLSQQSDLHAEALYQLSKLWGAAGKAARGAESSAKLEQLYPKSEWARKLASGG